MNDIRPWIFHPLIDGYTGAIDCMGVKYDVGTALEIRFDDVERVCIKDAGPSEAKTKSAHSFIFHFRSNFYSMRICNMESDAVISSKVLTWIEQYHFQRPFCQVFRLTSSEYIDWLNQTDICGTYNTPIPGLIHYMFITADQIIEIIDSEEPTIEVIKHE